MPSKLVVRACCLLVLVACTLPGSAWAVLARQQPYEVLEREPARGQQCLVCGKAVDHGQMVEIRYKGRRFFVSEEMLATFADHPQAYLSKIEARSALFDEGAQSPRGLADLWLWLGLYVLAGLLCGAACGYLAIGKSLSPLPWFLAGLAGNVAALLLVSVVPAGRPAGPDGVPAGLRKVPSTRSPVECPSCRASLHPCAESCPHCGARLHPASPSEARLAAD
ncbi:MAG TPA: hypothetical protein VLU25_12595 [Acidobacteriota bacterium]|nr:hypothetical protein [Acidobacteriota bacterium]